ncbi:MAG: pilus assembly protein N-terminal domain-containing protein, partial [Bythopirellula sp.]
MYDQTMRARVVTRRTLVPVSLMLFVALPTALLSSDTASAQEMPTAGFGSPKIIRKISRQSERLEMTTNSSRILTLDMTIPRVQVNNPELVAVTPLSATQIQVSAKKPGVTQVNLWDSDQKVHTIDVIIYGDVRELEVALRTQFPNSSVDVRKYSQSLMLTGFVDSPDNVSPIMRLAEDYAPKVINNLQVGGVQQVLLKVQLYEISRTKLRRLGVDWAQVSSGGGF